MAEGRVMGEVLDDRSGLTTDDVATILIAPSQRNMSDDNDPDPIPPGGGEVVPLKRAG